MSIIEKKSLVGDVDILLVDASPITTAVDASGGSLICWEGDDVSGRPNLWFYKRDDGLTTNVQPLAVYNYYAEDNPPTASNDSTEGAYWGSKYYTVDNRIFECANPAVGAAVWLEIGT